VGAGHNLVGRIDVGSYTAKVFDPEMLQRRTQWDNFCK